MLKFLMKDIKDIMDDSVEPKFIMSRGSYTRGFTIAYINEREMKVNWNDGLCCIYQNSHIEDYSIIGGNEICIYLD